MTAPSRRLVTGLLALVALATCLVTVPDPAVAAPDEKVTLCHRSHSRTNPYDEAIVAKSAAYEAHGNHTGPIFFDDTDHWGDIIPPVPPQLPDGRNWTAEGRAILDNNCEVPPDVGPLGSATIGDAACVGPTPSVDVTVSNAAEATDPATFTIRVDGNPVQTVGPVAPGDSETVTLAGVPEDRVAVVEVVSGGEVVASRVVTADCAPGPPPVTLSAQLVCSGQDATSVVEVTNGGTDPIEVSAEIDGEPFGPVVTVAPGATESREIDLSQFEDRTVTARLLVGGDVFATYTITPDCVAPVPQPHASVDRLVCAPPLLSVTLGNDGDPASSVVFGVRIDNGPVQTSAPLYGGDTTTIVLDLAPFEDQTVRVRAGYNGTVLVDQRVTVDCVDDRGTGPANGGTTPDDGVLPVVGAGFPAGLLVLGLALVAAGVGVMLAGARVRR